MVIIDIVINTLLGRLILDHAGMHCPAYGTMLLFLVLFVARVRYILNSYCVAVYHRLWVNFHSFFQRFFRSDCPSTARAIIQYPRHRAQLVKIIPQ